MNHKLIMSTLIWHKGTPINPTTKFLGVKVGGPSTNTTFTISVTNTK